MCLKLLSLELFKCVLLLLLQKLVESCGVELADHPVYAYSGTQAPTDLCVVHVAFILLGSCFASNV